MVVGVGPGPPRGPAARVAARGAATLSRRWGTRTPPGRAGHGEIMGQLWDMGHHQPSFKDIQGTTSKKGIIR